MTDLVRDLVPTIWRHAWTEPATTGPRLLLITHAFPPAPQAGSARWGSLAQRLSRMGFAFDVLMLHPEAVDHQLDWQRLADLPSSVRIAGIPLPPPPRWFRALQQTRRYLRPEERFEPVAATTVGRTASVADRPDLRARLGHRARIARMRGWCDAVVAFARAHAAADTVAVISSSPPHFVHRPAAAIAHRLGIPHVVDLRDPWESWGPGPDDQVATAAERRLIIEQAALVLANTESAGATVAEEFPSIRSRVHILSNAVDLPPQDRVPSDCFTIAHCGTLYLDRDPRAFFRAVRRLVDDVSAERPIRLEWMGVDAVVEGEPLAAVIDKLGLTPFTVRHGLRPRHEAFELLARSAVAVALQGEATTQIPAKIFDYMAFPLRILALVGERSATADLLRGTSAFIHALDDEDAILSALRSAYDEFIRGDVPVAIGTDPRFSRQHQAEQLSALLRGLGRS